MNNVILIVLDGFGVAPPSLGNAISQAKPQNLAGYLHLYPHTVLKASGEAVGLPAGEVGSTEVGHLNLGAGRIVYQNLPRINLAIADGSFYKNDIFLNAINHAKKNKSALHLLGLISTGIVHASMEHLFALLNLCKQENFTNAYLHLITDGRDSPPKTAALYLADIDKHIKELGVGKIASIMGRFYGMDRDKRWERTEKAYRCLTLGEGEKASDWKTVVDNAYNKNITDEFIEPTLIVANGETLQIIKSGDSVVFFNFRIDRPRQLTKAFVLDEFQRDANNVSYDPYATKYYKKHEVEDTTMRPPFERGKKIADLLFVTMTEYEKELPVQVAYPAKTIDMPLGRIIAEHNLKQLRMAESEKERFVTFYFNGLREQPFEGEERLIVPSPKVPTYDKKPEMSSFDLTEEAVKRIREKKHAFILINFACPDMVGHTGNLKAAIKAVTTVDECVGRIVMEGLAMESTIIITGDHGNVEQMLDATSGQISTEHSDSSVYFMVIGESLKGRSVMLRSGILADVAPTILSLMELNKPNDMTGRNLLEELAH